EKLGLEDNQVYLRDGSGLSYHNRVSPEAIVKLLLWVYFHSDFATEFKRALARGGIDGTLRKRFTADKYRGKVWGKTGSLQGISALSGYVFHEALPLVFSCLLNGSLASDIAYKKSLEDQLIQLLIEHIDEQFAQG
ncbi:MAG TPA: D-alanyl-D-alanine carboxypeptidase, partial [Candidatus Babeliaceae bacterium]|nr:D-alanyl-D-alanine carboxypeptidase [Candidatus Babeliaceae bacterium]